MSGLLFWVCILGIIYVYFGYPLILMLLAQMCPKQAEYTPVQPKVSLIIAAYNEEDVIAEKLNNSLIIDYPRENLQILVAADGSDDRTVEIAKSYENKGVELSYEPARRGKMAAINRAIALARHEVVIFSDANNLYQVDTLREIVKPFSDPSVGAVSGSKKIIKGDGALSGAEGVYWQYESFIKMQETRLSSCTSVSGEIFAIRRRLYEAPPDIVINDDFFIAMQIIRQGYRVVYAPNAFSLERASKTEKDEIIRRTRMVAGRYQAIGMAGQVLPFQNPLVLWQVISHKLLRPLVPFAMLGAFFANLLAILLLSSQKSVFLFLSFPYNWIFMILQSAFYLVAWLGKRIEATSPFSKILYIPTYLVNSNLAALLGFFKYITGAQTVIWKRVSRQRGE